MSDIYLDEGTGDIALVGNTPVLIKDNAQLVRQRLQIRLNTFLEEWFYNSEVGVPYFENVLKKPYNKALVESTFRSAILGTEGVIEIIFFSSEFDPITRIYKLDFTVTTPFGNVSVQI